MDIQGYIIEKITGQSLPDFMRDHLFMPLGMRDAGFYVPADKRERFATLYENDGHDGLQPDTSNGSGMGDFLSPPTRPSGGGGLVSTAEDYYRFAQMLGNSGELGGVRILAPSSVRLMDTNHLPASCSLANSTWARKPSAPASATAMTAPCSSIRRPPICPTARTLSSGMAPPAPGTGSTPRTTSSSSA